MEYRKRDCKDMCHGMTVESMREYDNSHFDDRLMELTGQTDVGEIDGREVTLHRVRFKKDVSFRYTVGNKVIEKEYKVGDLGGWVESLANLGVTGLVIEQGIARDNSYVCSNWTESDHHGRGFSHGVVCDGEVVGNGVVFNSYVGREALVSGKVWDSSVVGSKVLDNALVHVSHIKDGAVISESANVQHTIVSSGKVYGNATVISCSISGNGQVFDSACIERVIVQDNARVYGNAIVERGNIVLSDRAEICGDFKWRSNIEIGGFAKLISSEMISDESTVKRSYTIDYTEECKKYQSWATLIANNLKNDGCFYLENVKACEKFLIWSTYEEKVTKRITEYCKGKKFAYVESEALDVDSEDTPSMLSSTNNRQYVKFSTEDNKGYYVAFVDITEIDFEDELQVPLYKVSSLEDIVKLFLVMGKLNIEKYLQLDSMKAGSEEYVLYSSDLLN